MIQTEVVSLVSLAVGSVGAVLGVINTWNALDRQKVKLLIRPAQSYLTPTFEPIVTIEVLNLSAFPITISEIGFQLTDGKKAIAIDKMLNGKPLPQRIESRDSVTAFFRLGDFDIKMIRAAFASTTCGEQEEGTSKSLQQLIAGGNSSLPY